MRNFLSRTNQSDSGPKAKDQFKRFPGLKDVAFQRALIGHEGNSPFWFDVLAMEAKRDEHDHPMDRLDRLMNKCGYKVLESRLENRMAEIGRNFRVYKVEVSFPDGTRINVEFGVPVERSMLIVETQITRWRSLIHAATSEFAGDNECVHDPRALQRE